MTERLTIDIFSDVMCPWCIIGYKQLQKALATLDGEIEAEVRWRPFELNPDMPPEGEDSAEHVMRKYGRSEEQAAAGRSQMAAIAEKAGYSFAYTGEEPEPRARMRNSFLAHKLLAHALRVAGPDVQTALKLALFDAHFQQRRDIGSREVLLDLAGSVGLDCAAAEAALADPKLSEFVRSEEAQAWDMNISGVPAMVVNGRFLVPGAQEPQVYVDLLRRVVARERVGATTV